jgi:hypothetical protein
MSPESSPFASAQELHEILVQAFRIENVTRRKFLRALAAMATSGLHFALGFPSIAGYAECHFRLSRPLTYEYVRVGGALKSLPALDRAFSEGRMAWSVVREVTRVATAETEEEWIRFAKEHTFAQLRAEVKDALKKNRTRPREGSYGLPNLTVAVRFELTPEEHELVSKAFGKLASELGAKLGEEGQVDRKAALLYLAERVLESDAPGEELGERVERKDSPYTILYHQCPDCRRSALSTEDGLVEVEAEVVERVAGEAETVVISPEEERHGEVGEADRVPVPAAERDRPNTPELTRKVFLRDGRVCSNPYCGRTLGLHAHHIEFRAHGGRTALANEVLVCRACHALLHQGALRIEGNPLDGLRFVPRGPGEASAGMKDFERTLRELAAIKPGAESIIIDSSPPLAGLTEALRSLGYSREEAERRVARASETLGESASEEEILAEALRRAPAPASLSRDRRSAVRARRLRLRA